MAHSHVRVHLSAHMVGTSDGVQSRDAVNL